MGLFSIKSIQMGSNRGFSCVYARKYWAYCRGNKAISIEFNIDLLTDVGFY